jgi:hypothetical protein
MRSEVVGKKEELTLAHTPHKSTCALHIWYHSSESPCYRVQDVDDFKTTFRSRNRSRAGSVYPPRCRRSLATLHACI